MAIGDHSSLRDIENRLRRVSVDDGDEMDGRVDAADTKAMRGKDILQELGVPSSDIELLLADPDGKLDPRFQQLKRDLSHFSLEQSWMKHSSEDERWNGKSRLMTLGVPPSDCESLL